MPTTDTLTPDALRNVGTTFIRTTSRTWQVDDGSALIHTLVMRCEVVEVDATGFDWRRLEILREDDAPTTFTPDRPERGSTAWFVVPTYIARGTLAADTAVAS